MSDEPERCEVVTTLNFFEINGIRYCELKALRPFTPAPGDVIIASDGKLWFKQS